MHVKKWMLVAFIMPSLLMLLLLSSSAFAREAQQDKAAGDGAKEILAEMGVDANDSDVRNMKNEEPRLRTMSVQSTSSSWGLRFANGMLDGQVARGIDISCWQGASNDFSKALNDGLEFAIIRCGYGNNEIEQDDEYWLNNVRQARDNGVPFGVYIYSYATNTSMAVSEAQHVLRQLDAARSKLGIQAADITYPVYMDFEDPSQASLSRNEIHTIIDAFAKTVKTSSAWSSLDIGYYSFRYWAEDDNKLNTLKTYWAGGKEHRYSRWVAEWGTNSSGCIHELHNNAGTPISPTWYDLWQVSSQEKKVAGIGGGFTDIDFAYKNFAADISGSMGSSSVTAEVTYTGKEQYPAVSASYGTANPRRLSKGQNYTVSYANNVDVGIGTVTLNGTGRYRGTRKETFAINPANIALAEMQPIPAQSYLGGESCPEVSLSYEGHVLAEGRDYELAYSSNATIGVAKIKIWGIGNFTGTRTESFSIVDSAGEVPDSGLDLCKDVLEAGGGKVFVIGVAGKSFDIEGNSPYDGANVRLWKDNKTPAQRFRMVFRKISGDRGYYRVFCVGSGKVLDVSGNSPINGANLNQWEANGTDAQKWKIELLGGGRYKMVNCRTGKAITADGTNLTMFTSSNRISQSLSFTATETVAEGTYRIDSTVKSFYALDVDSASKASGANVWVWKRNGTGAQSFKLSYNAQSGYYVIQNTNSGKLIDVAGAEKADGTNIWQYARNGTAAQNWDIEKVSGGGYVLRSAINGSALDLCSGLAFDGSNIHLWHVNGTAAQKWKLTKL